MRCRIFFDVCAGVNFGSHSIMDQCCAHIFCRNKNFELVIVILTSTLTKIFIRLLQLYLKSFVYFIIL